MASHAMTSHKASHTASHKAPHATAASAGGELLGAPDAVLQLPSLTSAGSSQQRYMGPPPVYAASLGPNAWLRQHPALPCSSTDATAEGAASRRRRRGAHSAVAIALYGIAGNTAGKAGDMRVSVDAALDAARSHKRYVIEPAARARDVHVFAHFWVRETDQTDAAIVRALRSEYGGYLRNATAEKMVTREHVLSMVLSMTTALRLARSAAAAQASSYALLLLMRHDTYWHAELPLPPAECARDYVTVASWCISSPPLLPGVRKEGAACGRLGFQSMDGIHDYWLLGSAHMLEWLLGSLEQRLRSGGTAAVHANGRAHFVLQAQLDRLGLTQRGLVRSHPASLSYVHFTLWRWRAFETNVTAALRAATDGKDEAGAAVAAEQLRSLSCATPDGGKGGGSLVCLANVSAVQAPGAHSGGVPWE